MDGLSVEDDLRVEEHTGFHGEITLCKQGEFFDLGALQRHQKAEVTEVHTDGRFIFFGSAHAVVDHGSVASEDEDRIGGFHHIVCFVKKLHRQRRVCEKGLCRRRKDGKNPIFRKNANRLRGILIFTVIFGIGENGDFIQCHKITLLWAMPTICHFF